MAPQAYNAASSDSINAVTAPIAGIARPRLDSLDLWRGAIIVLMALDHTRDFFEGFGFPPENLARTTPALFFARWITHFCAPGFFFLAGAGAYLWSTRGKSHRELSSFLIKRGLWLALLEITVIDFGWTFRISPIFSVIWVLGWSMVLLGLVTWLPAKWVGWLGVTICLLHNLLDRIDGKAFGNFDWLWTLLHQPGVIAFHNSPRIVLAPYPLIPWFGVMAAGYGFGVLMQRPGEQRRRLFLVIGSVMTVAFIVLRFTGIYGNASVNATIMPDAGGPFHSQATFAMSVVAFFDVSKYPPSLLFLLMTLGPSLMALAWFDRYNERPAGKFARAVIVYGRVPLFFYVVHIYVLHVLAIIVAMIARQPYGWLLHGGILAPADSGYGHSLLFCYGMWLLVVAILYYPCAWYGNIKRRSRSRWFSYL
jgi:uncharacterized membrane protein